MFFGDPRNFLCTKIFFLVEDEHEVWGDNAELHFQVSIMTPVCSVEGMKDTISVKANIIVI
jgi:hypothetical protein